MVAEFWGMIGYRCEEESRASCGQGVGGGRGWRGSFATG